MKTNSQILALAIAAITLFGVSCASTDSERPIFSFGRSVTFEEISKMPPFTATVQYVNIDHPFFIFGTSVEIWLHKPETKTRLVLDWYPANKYLLGFAHSLHEGQSYVFPQVFADYENSQTTNVVK